jgi:metallo-beta-lactamase family protein
MEITFFGAAGGVTGSKHLISTNGFNLLLDCGMFQGKRKITNDQNKELPFSADKIDAVILSHAHLDHCGTLPILVKNGFKGKIYCTGATAEIAKYIMLDSASIQTQDAEYFNKHQQSEADFIEPIYTEQDVNNVLDHFEVVQYFYISEEWTKLNENIRFKFYDAGHILGSAITFLEIKEGQDIKTLTFTGDLGRDSLPILRSPEIPDEESQNLIMECTYGDRLHRQMEDVYGELKNSINDAVKSGGKIIVPAFSLGRTQELIYMLHKLIDEKLIPEIPIYIDSPLGVKITDVFSEYVDNFDEDFWKDFGNKKEAPFTFKNLKYVKTVAESKSLNDMAGPFMVISASGMAEGGRILHHLKNNVSDPKNTILITGFQAENTLGRRIQENISPVIIFGRDYELRAKVITLSELSAHADQKDLLDFVGKLKGLKNLFLVHTEKEPVEVFKKLAQNEYPNIDIKIPELGEEFSA